MAHTPQTVGNVYLSRDYFGAGHSESLMRTDPVIFINKTAGIEKCIVDEDGNILDFPGIEPCPELSSEINLDALKPQVRYEASFKKCKDGGYAMIWTVRPDGRYWMDSWGFGAEDYEWVELYTVIDENGCFTAPFRLYSIGYRKFAEEITNESDFS